MSSTTVLPQGEPRRLGSAYVLDARIGAGAQGEVWRGHRTESPGTPLAVKLLRAELLDDGAVVQELGAQQLDGQGRAGALGAVAPPDLALRPGADARIEDVGAAQATGLALGEDGR